MAYLTMRLSLRLRQAFKVRTLDLGKHTHSEQDRYGQSRHTRYVHLLKGTHACGGQETH